MVSSLPLGSGVAACFLRGPTRPASAPFQAGVAWQVTSLQVRAFWRRWQT
jgi:hypothetical protein